MSVTVTGKGFMGGFAKGLANKFKFLADCKCKGVLLAIEKLFAIALCGGTAAGVFFCLKQLIQFTSVGSIVAMLFGIAILSLFGYIFLGLDMLISMSIMVEHPLILLIVQSIMNGSFMLTKIGLDSILLFVFIKDAANMTTVHLVAGIVVLVLHIILVCINSKSK